MKVIFLDIDGVLNHEDWFEKSRKQMAKAANEIDVLGKMGKCIFWTWHIDPEKVNLIHKIQKETQAKIVLSSSWRHMKDIQRILEMRNIEFIDITPDFVDDLRGNEIQAWLNQHSKVENFVILDDDSDMLDTQKDNFIQTDGLKGIQEEHVQQAIEILNS
jgi:hypothetical protein